MNGEQRQVEEGNVVAVLAQLGIDPEALLVEHNGVALHRREWSEHRVVSGDVLELIRIVAGG